MAATVVCPSCKFVNSGSALSCVKCQASLIGIPRDLKPFTQAELAAQQRAREESELKENTLARVESPGFVLWRSFRATLVVFLGVALFVAFVCYMCNMRTLTDFGTGLMYAGAVLVFVGWYIFRGSTALAGDQTSHHNPMNMGMPGTLSSRTRQRWSDYMDGINTVAFLGFLAALCIGLGWLIVSLVR